MESLAKFGALRAKFEDSVDFLTVYISEAHPMEEGYMLDKIYDLRIHQNLEDRIVAARLLKTEAGENLRGCPIVVDLFDNKAELAYAALPERLYVVQDGILVYQGKLGPFGYNLDEVEQFLENKKTK